MAKRHTTINWLLLSIASALLLNTAFAQKAAEWSLSESRLVMPEDKTSGSIVFASHSALPWLVSAAVYDSNAYGKPTERSHDFVVSPPVKAVAGGEKLALRLVRTTKSTSETEKLYYLRVQVLPGQTKQTEKSGLQLTGTAWIKVFVRPKGLGPVDADHAPVLKEACASGYLWIQNPSSYWVTLRGALSGTRQLISHNKPAPMLSPNGVLKLRDRWCRHPAKLKIIDDWGFEIPAKTSEGL